MAPAEVVRVLVVVVIGRAAEPTVRAAEPMAPAAEVLALAMQAMAWAVVAAVCT